MAGQLTPHVSSLQSVAEMLSGPVANLDESVRLEAAALIRALIAILAVDKHLPYRLHNAAQALR